MLGLNYVPRVVGAWKQGEDVVRGVKGGFVGVVECARYWSPANFMDEFLLAGSFCVCVCVCASGCYLWFCVCSDLVCDGENCYGCGVLRWEGQELVADTRAIIYYNSCPEPNE